MVLEELINENFEKGDRIIKINAQKIKQIKKAKIIKPAKGEKVTDKEYIAIMRETNRKRDEMYEQSNGIEKK